MGNEEQIDDLEVGVNSIVRDDTYTELLRQRELLQQAIEESEAMESDGHREPTLELLPLPDS
ncbi:hypothetical protein [Limnohabitans sp. 2KL-3]|uniref:hypothetical protein n=1 Tax=Limnohabitans sp. 2KL-3 TaxID=1100700 RepID=UPI000B2F2B8D|nr:hypothetical protein [Limnohabitans sp. 2KL-3]